MKRLIFVILIAATAACQTPRPEPLTSACNLATDPLEVDLDPVSSANAIGVETPAADNFFLKMLEAARPGDETVEGIEQPLRQLVLSGGGQHGAFSAGFLDGAPDFPEYDVVTGISTGALQSPFALLGKRIRENDLAADPEEDDFPRDSIEKGKPHLQDIVAGYTIEREKTLYNNEGKLAIIRKARMGDLRPLRRRTNILVSHQTMSALAALKKEREEEGLFPQLRIALLNWNSGVAESVDMMALVDRYALGSPKEKELARDCFIEVMIASASEPLGAPGVVIDDKLYFDAGLRYGVFSSAFAEGARLYVEKRRTPPGAGAASQPIVLTTDAIRNGKLDVGEFEKDEFSALDLVKRGQKILVNQVYGFSADNILKSAGCGHEVRFAYITPEEMAAGPPQKEAIFDPLYMKRMIGVGRDREGKWNVTRDQTSDGSPSCN